MRAAYLAIPASFGVFGASAAHAGEGTITIVRPGPCSALEASPAADGLHVSFAASSDRQVLVVRGPSAAAQRKGWASKRLLRRFDLQFEERGVRIVNASPFCVEER